MIGSAIINALLPFRSPGGRQVVYAKAKVGQKGRQAQKSGASHSNPDE